MFDDKIENSKDEMINELKHVISFKSISDTNSDSNYPFGDECNNCLNYVLELGKRLGFRTKNIDGYCGYIEFGEGEDLIGLIGHLDVVPVNDDWTFEPFNAKVADGKIYGRGAIDDKGPVIASIYAMKAVMDTCKIHKRVRLILGLNEEKDWKCIDYYKMHEETPICGFSPDADFPVIYAEKGILSYYYEQDYLGNEKIKIKNVVSQEPFNVVPKECKVYLETINIEKTINDINEVSKKHNYEIIINKLDDKTIILTAKGKAAHAAHPDLGENAVSKMIIVLNELFEKNECKIELLEFFSKYINMEYNGELLQINYKDESGSLTLNTAKFIIEDNKLKIGFNLRIPVHTKIKEVEQTLQEKLAGYRQINYTKVSTMNPLYIDPESDLIKKLLDIYNNKTKSKEKPIAIGGATYARAFNNFVSFGANMPGHIDMCHKNDEYAEINGLILSSKIYAEAIYELCR